MPPAYPYSVYSFGNWESFSTVDPFAEMEDSSTTTPIPTTTSIPTTTAIPTTTSIPTSTFAPSTSFIPSSTFDPRSTFVPTMPSVIVAQIPDVGVENNEIEWVGGGIGAIVFSLIIWLLSRWLKRRGNSGTYKVEPVVERCPVRLIELDDMSELTPPPPPPPPIPTPLTTLDRPTKPFKAEECARDTLMRQIRESYTMRQAKRKE